jgi:D-sedoheptulose 7-phosphate isomerase
VDPDEARSYAEAYFLQSADVTERTAKACLDDVLAAAEILAASLHRGGKVLICGNGGSAADAQHLAAEFVSTLTKDNLRQALGAIALTTDTSILTAISNDFGYDGVFERQVEALGRPGDVVLGISTSGNSTNVVRAFERARDHGMRRIALTGEDGGAMEPVADVTIRVPSDHTGHIQEAQTAVEHLLASLVERAILPA